MNINQIQDRQTRRGLLEQGEAVFRRGPGSSVLKAILVGLSVGYLFRAFRRRPVVVQLGRRDLFGWLQPFGRQARHALTRSSRRVRGGVERFADLEVRPHSHWWQRIGR